MLSALGPLGPGVRPALPLAVGGPGGALPSGLALGPMLLGRLGAPLGMVRPGPAPIYLPPDALLLPGMVPPIGPPRIFGGGMPIGGEASLFFPAGAPIARLGLVWYNALPLSGPVPQIFRGGGPVPPTLPAITLTPGGPVGAVFVGSGGGPIGVLVIGGGGLPIGPAPPVGRAIAAEQARTALVSGPAIGFPGTG